MKRRLVSVTIVVISNTRPAAPASTIVALVPAPLSVSCLVI